MNTTTCFLSIASLFVSGVLSSASAALPPRDPENLDQAATLIITGVAMEVTSSTTDGRFSDWIATIEAKIETVKKGPAKADDTITIRCWRPNKRPDGWAGPAGHFGIPAKGSHFKMWLRKRDDGIWEPLEPNGINLRDGDAAFRFEKAKSVKPGFFRRLFGG